MSEERVVYSIQQTYIIKPVSKFKKQILTCEQRIDIPTIEPLTDVTAVVYSNEFSKIIPCIELVGKFLDKFELAFETNEGVTVLPVKIYPGVSNPLDNPYKSFRYLLVLPRGATGVKLCKIIHKDSGEEVQHNFTFGIMPPPYNYDNALFGYISYRAKANYDNIRKLENKVNSLKLVTQTPTFERIDLPKGAGKQTINIEQGVLFYETVFAYPSSDPTKHKPKITLHGGSHNDVYTLSLNKTINVVSIDLFTGVIRVSDTTGEITKQFKLSPPSGGYETLSFENFDEIGSSSIEVTARGAWVK